MIFDYLIVGAGFAGSTCARLLADAGKKVLLIDARNHVGGNAYDRVNDHGVLIHEYGLHIFHTNSRQVFDFLSRFTDWNFYEHRVKSFVDGELKQFPPRGEETGNVTDNTSAKSYIISKAGQDIWDRYYRGYTLKQWGRDGADLPASTAARVPVRSDDDDRYFTDRYQVMPRDGYTKMFERMLDHENITTELNTPFSSDLHDNCERIIYTGRPDAYYNYCCGFLPFRNVQFSHETSYSPELKLPAAQLNYPSLHVPFTREYEHRWFTGQRHDWTTITREYAYMDLGSMSPFYPVRNDAGNSIWRKYQALMSADKKVLFTGRLGSFRYYNMDQVVAQSLRITNSATAFRAF